MNNSNAIRFLRLLGRPTSRSPVCRQCRSIQSSSALYAGHNKWSKIRHEKGAADAKKNSVRSHLSRNLASACKLFGEGSPQAATAIAAAKKAGLPKNVMEAAIARGLGRSATGAVLESMVFEAIMPPSSVAIIIEVETDSRGRSLQDITIAIKRHKATPTPAKFLFTRKGRVVFGAGAGDEEPGALLNRIMDAAIEAGAEDLETDEDGNVVVWTEPTQVSQMAKDVGTEFGLETLSTDILWSPNDDTMATVGSTEEAKQLAGLLAALREFSDVQAVYSNASRGTLSEEDWALVDEHLDS